MSRKKKNKHNHKDKAQENVHTDCEPKLDTDNVEENDKSKVEDEGTIESHECEKDSSECDTHTLLEQTRKDLDEARADSIEWKDKYMRVYAQWDTYRRRTEAARSQDKVLATQKLIEDILPILDDFERTIDYANKNGTSGLIDGVCAVSTKLLEACKKSGLDVIDPEEGSQFNALEHQVIQSVEDSSLFDESVKTCVQKGYKMGVKVLRPASVVITTGGAKRQIEDREDTTSSLDDEDE